MTRPTRSLFFFALSLGLSTAWAATTPVTTSTGGVTLADCFQKARQINETIGISAENVRALQEQYRVQVGAVLPHIDWIKSQFYQQNINSPSNSGTGGATNSSLIATQPLSYFQLTQPIFAGFRDWDVIGITKSQEEQARLNQVSTDLQLLTDVATAFFAAYTLQDQLSVLLETRKLNQDQADQLNRWVNIGRSRSSDLLSAETQLASLDAQIQDTQRTSAESRHLLFFLTGIPADVPLIDQEPAAAALSLDEALTRAGKRPDILSSVESLHQAELEIKYARGAHWPVLTGTGRYYTERVGFLSDIRWDATFLLDVPIFEGGSTYATTQQARSQQIIAQLTLARLKRDVDRQVRTAYDDLSRAVTEVEAYDKAVTLAQKNYSVQQKENRLGVTSNLELLQLLTNMQNIRGQSLVSRANARLDDILLRVAMGEGL